MAAKRERRTLHPLTALGAWDAPPLNRIEVTKMVLRLFIFAMFLVVLKK